MKKLGIAALVIVALAAFTIIPVSAQVDPGAGCIAGTKIYDTIHGDIYFEQQGFGYYNSMTKTFNSVPDGIKVARIYTGFWQGSPGKGGFFNITIQNATGSYTSDTCKACDPCPNPQNCVVDGYQPQRCDALNNSINWDHNEGLDTINMHDYIVGCGVHFISFNATPYITPGSNTITVKTEPCSDCTRGRWDGRIYLIALLVVYENESMPEITYWINEGAPYLEEGSDCDGPDDHYYASKYFNGTHVNNPTGVRLWSLGWPHVINADTKLNDYNIGDPDITESYGSYEILLRWANIPTSYLDDTSNFLEYYDLNPVYERAFAEVLIVQGPELAEKPDLIVTDINAYHNNTGCPAWFNLSNEIDVTVKNNGTTPAGASNVSLYIDDEFFGRLPVSSLSAGASETVTFENWKPIGDDCLKTIDNACYFNWSYNDYNFTGVADCDNDVAESNETNNEMVFDPEKTRACYNGYMADEPLENVTHGMLHGHLIFTTGDGVYSSLYNYGDTQVTNYDIKIPDNATVKLANMNVYYTWCKPKAGIEVACPEMEVSINGQVLPLEKAYNDVKCTCPGASWVYPWGNYVYNVTDYIDGSGTYTVTVKNNCTEKCKYFCPAAPGIVLVYEDENAPMIEYWINKGADILMGGRRHPTSSNLCLEECINNATFPASAETGEVVNATLGVVAPWGDDVPDDILFFNDVEIGRGVYLGYNGTYDETIDSISMHIGSTNAQVGVNVTNVTALYLKGNDNVVGQADDGDNMMPSNAFLVVEYKYKMPDLVITNKSETFEDGTFTVTYTVANVGDGDASESNTTIFIDGVPKKEDPVPALAAGESCTNTVGPFDCPCGATLSITVCADNENVVEECNEENNCLSNELVCPGIPDLVVEKSVTIEDGTFIVNYTVMNIGCGLAGESTTCKFVDGELKESQTCPALGSSESYHGTFGREPCPCGATLNVTVCADNYDEVDESDETNNCEVNKVVYPGKPDLVITEKNETFVDGGNFTMTYKVNNTGCAEAGASHTTIYIDGVPLDVSTPAIPKGECHENTAGPFECPCGATLNVTVCADNYDEVEESNETNNCKVNEVKCPVVGKPDLLVIEDINAYHNNIGSPAWFTLSNEIDVTVKNNGSAVAGASNVSLYIDGEFFGKLPVSSLSAGANETVTFENWMPIGEDCLQPPCKFEWSYKDYNIMGVADCDSDIAESNETNNETTVVDRACYNGYMADEPLENVAHGKLHGHLIFTTGDGKYSSLCVDDTQATNYDVNLPEGASVKLAHLNVYYTWSMPTGSCPEMEVKITTPGGTTDTVRFMKAYNDIKCRCPGTPWEYSFGNYVYDLKDYITEDGTYTVTVKNAGSLYFCPAAPGIVLVYEDENAPQIEYWINEGADLLIGGRRSDGGYLAWWECINNATFPASTTTGKVVNVTLGVVAPWGDEVPDDILFFNEIELGRGVYNRYGSPYSKTIGSITMIVGAGNAQVGVSVTSVTAHYLKGSDNMVGQADNGDCMMPANAFLVVEYKKAEPKPDLEIVDKWEEWVNETHYNVTYVIHNNGTATAPAGHNTTLYVDGVPIEHKHLPVALEPCETYTDTFDTVIECTGDSDTIKVCADNYDVVEELNETNNCLENVWSCSRKPDLEMVDKWEKWVNDTHYNVTYVIHNSGTAVALAGHHTTLYVDGVAIEHKQVPVDLDPCQNYTDTFDTVIECTDESDIIRVCADNYKVVDELDEDNNCQENVWTCLRKPDLEIVEKWEEWVNETHYNVTYVIHNSGTAVALAGHHTTLYVDGVEREHKQVPVDLDPCQNYTDTFDTVIECTGESDIIRVCADNYKVVDELDEDNNCLENVWTCLRAMPGISVNKVANPIAGPPSIDVTFTITVANTGDCTLNPVKVVDTLPEGMSYISSSPAADSHDGTIVWNDITDGAGLVKGASKTIKLVAYIDEGAAGMLTNVVTATGTPPAGADVHDRDTADIEVLAPTIVPPEETLIDITTEIKSDGTVIEGEQFGWMTGNGNLFNNPPLAPGEAVGGIKYDEKMIGSNGTTEFEKCFSVNTNVTPNIKVDKSIRYKSGDLGSLSHAEQVGMRYSGASPPLSSNTKCEEVNAYSEMVVSDVQATTETEVGITETEERDLHYGINAEGKGSVSAGVDASVEDGAFGTAPASRMTYKDKSNAYGGNFSFEKRVDYKSKPSTSITTDLKSDRTVIEGEQFGWESGNGNLLHNDKMIGSNGTTEFEKYFEVSTSNLKVDKSIGYKSGDLGSLSYGEQVSMRYSGTEVNAYSEMVVTDVEATTETEVGITERDLLYETDAKGKGSVSVGVDASVEDGRTDMTYTDKSNAYGGNFSFDKKVGYKSKPP